MSITHHPYPPFKNMFVVFFKSLNDLLPCYECHFILLNTICYNRYSISMKTHNKGVTIFTNSFYSTKTKTKKFNTVLLLP